MAKYSANPAPFNHVTDAAPEYVDVILWHRVALVLGALVIALAGMGYGIFTLISSGDDGISSPLAVNEMTQQQPPGAVPTSSEESSAPAASQQEMPAAQYARKTAPAAHAKDLVEKRAAQEESNPEQTATLASATTAEASINTPQITVDTASTRASQNQGRAHADYQVHTRILVPAVKRAMITDSIQGREPGKTITDTASLAGRDAFTLHQFIDIHGRAGDTLTWKWKHNGKPSTTIRIRVGTNTWRGYASKHFNPKLAGDWQVDVTDQRDILLARSEFHLGK